MLFCTYVTHNMLLCINMMHQMLLYYRNTKVKDLKDLELRELSIPFTHFQMQKWRYIVIKRLEGFELRNKRTGQKLTFAAHCGMGILLEQLILFMLPHFV